MSPPSARSLNVVLVEDNDGVRNSMAELICRDPSLRLIGAFSSAEAALPAVPRLQPDVALMDINLPGLSGVDCVRRLMQALPGLRIIMLTVREDADAIFASLEAGAVGYLQKPPGMRELLEAIHDVSAGGAPMAGAVARKVLQSFQAGQAATPRAAGNLTPRELEILKLLVEGLTYKEIAARLGLGYSTVHRHIEHIYIKLQVHSRAHAVARYLGAS